MCRMQVDRIEAEIMGIVPGVRYVDLETDRGRFTTYNKSSMDDVHLETFQAVQGSPHENEVPERTCRK
jgi:hypothetical protein